MNTVIIAIVMGIMYWWCRGMILSYFGFLFISSPVTVGLVAGLLMGQPMQGLIIGGGIALVFAGIFAPGANLPTDECLAATCVITRIIRNQFKKSDQHILCSKSK